MQHLLDFIHEHTLEEQLYLVVQTHAGELELIWQRHSEPEHWQIRPNKCEGPWELVERTRLLDALARRAIDLTRLERELTAMVLTQVAFADLVLRHATNLLGPDVVRRALIGHREFMGELKAAVDRLTAPPPALRPSMRVVAGGGAQSDARAGHLNVVR